MTAAVWGNLIQLATFAVVAATASIAIRQLTLMRHGGGGANVMDFWGRVQSDDARLQRRRMYEALEQFGLFDPVTWPEDSRTAIDHVCQLWSTAGALVRYDIVPERLVVDEWGPLIKRCWTICEPFVEFERQRRRNPALYDSFRRLAAAARGAV